MKSPLLVSTGTRYDWTSTSGLSEDQSGTIEITESGKVTTNYQKQYYVSIQASPPEEGTISPGSDWFDAGSQVQISASAASGYTFKSWRIARQIIVGSVSENPTIVTINDWGAIIAIFESIETPDFTLQVEKATYALGELVVISGTAKPDSYVAIEVRNSNDEIIFIDTPKSSGDGKYSTAFRIPTDARTGIYNIWANSEGGVRTITFEVLVQDNVIRVLFDLIHVEQWGSYGYQELKNEIGSRYRLYQFGRNQRDVGQISEDLLANFDILVLGNPQAFNFDPLEEQAIINYVNRGGSLLVIDGSYPSEEGKYPVKDIIEAFGIGHETRLDYHLTITDLTVHQITAGVQTLYMSHPSELKVSSPAQAIAFFQQQPVLAVSEYGNGRVVVMSDSNQFSDLYIGYNDNMALALNIFSWLSEGKFGPYPEGLPSAQIVSWTPPNSMIVEETYMVNVTIKNNRPEPIQMTVEIPNSPIFNETNMNCCGRELLGSSMSLLLQGDDTQTIGLPIVATFEGFTQIQIQIYTSFMSSFLVLDGEWSDKVTFSNDILNTSSSLIIEVTDSSGDPIQDLEVLLTNRRTGERPLSYRPMTDVFGRVFLNNLKPGTYNIIAGFGSNDYGITGRIVNLNNGETLEVSLTVVPQGYITGRVVYSDGKTVSDNYVDAMTGTVPYGWVSRTDSNGEFTFGKLVPGNYTVRVLVPGREGNSFSDWVEVTDVIVVSGQTTSEVVLTIPVSLVANQAKISI